MKILAIAATNLELTPLRECVSDEVLPYNVEVDFLATGSGVAATAYALTKALHTASYHLVLHVGIAGSYTDALRLGDVCLVEREVFADLGVDTADNFTTFFEQGLESPDAFPFTAGELVCPYLADYAALDTLPKVRSATVSIVSARPEVLAMRRQKFMPDIEGMEGAAVFYVCLQEAVPFIQLRAISNKVGVRDKSQWDIPLSLAKLAEEANRFIHSLG